MLKLTDISLVIAKIHETEFADKCPRWRQLCFNGCLYNIIYDSGLQCGSDSSSRRFQQYCVFITVSKLRNPTSSASGDSGVKLLLSRGQQPPLFSASPWLGCHRHALPPPAFVMCYDGGHAGLGCATC